MANKNKKSSIVVIGGSNIDIQGSSFEKINISDSNVGKIRMGVGGVGRNIAVNIKKLTSEVEFISVVGDDYYGEKILSDLKEKKIYTGNILKVKDNSSVYLSVLDNKNEMVVAVSDMDILKNINVNFLKSKMDMIKNADILVLDTNLTEETIEFIANNKLENQKLIVDTVSVKKAQKIKNILDKIDFLKTNRLELESVCDEKLKSMEEIKKCSLKLNSIGLKNIFVTLGPKGVIFSSLTEQFRITNPKNIEVKDVTGAGDIFTAALVFGVHKNLKSKILCKLAQSASLLKITRDGTDFESFNKQFLFEGLKKYHNINL